MADIRCPHCGHDISPDELDNARFDAHVSRSDGCWEWTGARQVFGYGAFGARGRNWSSHRWQWERYNGPVPRGMLVRHLCSNPRCVRPDHLAIGTQRDNMRDKVEQGRHRWGTVSRPGEAHPMAKLTNADVLAIRTRRAAGEHVLALAAEYGVSRSTIMRASKGQSWRHI